MYWLSLAVAVAVDSSTRPAAVQVDYCITHQQVYPLIHTRLQSAEEAQADLRSMDHSALVLKESIQVLSVDQFLTQQTAVA
jgi:hypothetical protein